MIFECRLTIDVLLMRNLDGFIHAILILKAIAKLRSILHSKMGMGLVEIFNQMAIYPTLGVILALVVLVTLVSGATDAPNAIATAVSTRCMKVGTALGIAAVANFVGLIAMTYVTTAVAETMFNMVNFGSSDAHISLMALMAAMIASIG